MMKKSIFLPERLYPKKHLSPDNPMYDDFKFEMKNAHRSCFETSQSKCLVQEFDGRSAYLYSYQIHLKIKQTFLIRAGHNDLHGIYILAATGKVTLSSRPANQQLHILPSQSSFLYLPEGFYRIDIPKGITHLFGYHFDSKIFRLNYKRKFDFIKPLIDAHWGETNLPIFGETISIDSRTRLHIHYLCNKLNEENIRTEVNIVSAIVHLLELSKENFLRKFSEESSQHVLAESTRLLIEDLVSLHGHNFKIEEIYQLLGYKKTTVHRAHQRIFGDSILKLQKQTYSSKGIRLT